VTVKPLTKLESARIQYQNKPFFKELVDAMCARMLEGGALGRDLEGAVQMACQMRWGEAEKILKACERECARKGGAWSDFMQFTRRRFDRGMRDERLFQEILDAKRNLGL
jgi:hypothetical protein